MKHTLKSLFILLCITTACSKSGDQKDHEAHDMEYVESPNTALYDKVMELHDELMPKMEEIYNLKKEVQEEIAKTPEMVEEKKKDLEKTMVYLDSANNEMMDWMHKFNPLPDSADQEAAREYLENEMEKIRKVKDIMAEAIDKAKEEMKK
jgi:hypothetical protein